MLNATYALSKLFGSKLGRRTETKFGETLWVYPSSQGSDIVVWVEPTERGEKAGEEPVCVILSSKQLGDFIAAARSQAALSQVQHEERQRAVG
jgi:hypothetical protein